MPPNLPASGRVRSSAAVNEDIRALARSAWGRPFTDAERAEYGRLLVEWSSATAAERRIDVVTAA
jgi:hypothetical protein